ncbi:hypothetical protein [Yersinia aleksiciae]|uniref:hypothetical protein n=1 Tax=Yersinia aleksiciae TaxID=263819 RepID=UPI001427CEA4|nr:hypothetical protein [Yersinia aleksiciae]MDA5498619.1 hypothetical protein [Yersinia aleksiciae]NIK99334.1 hypothetical protein [Yersinia aleksiciae]WQC71273.1 hypothetical protein N0K21_01945 [Yersinia aleksiciae]
MDSNPNFFDATDLFKIPELFDIPNGLHSVDAYAEKFHIRLGDIIAAWLDNRIKLYVNLRSEYCRINRYANKKEHRYDTFDISVGRDFYQHERSPQSTVRKFIPCNQSEIKEDMNFNGSSFYKYVYNGYASGFWRLQLTNTTHLVTGNYNLKNSNVSWDEIPGEVRVLGRDDKDYLVFNKDIFVSDECLYIDGSGCQELFQLLKIEERKVHEVEGYYIQNFIMLMLLKVNFAKENGEINRTEAANILNSIRGDYNIFSRDISSKTISRWVKNSLIEEGKLSLETEDGRLSTIKDNAIYLLVRYGHANCTSKELAGLLIKESSSYQLQQSITLSQLVNYLDILFLKNAPLNLK